MDFSVIFTITVRKKDEKSGRTGKKNQTKKGLEKDFALQYNNTIINETGLYHLGCS